MEITNPKIENYMEKLLTNRKPIFFRLEKYAREIGFPIVGPLVGQILKQYARLIKAKSVIELGSGFGYSAIWFAEAIEENGEIICTDFSGDYAQDAKDNFKEAKTKSKINFQIGDAMKILEDVDKEFDIIFNDVEKEDYPEVFDIAIPKLKKGGLLITDNTLWYGRILNEKDLSDATEGVREYNRKAFTDPRVLTVILPIRDGITVSLKV